MIEIEGCPLCAFEEDTLTSTQRLVDLESRVDGERENPLPELHALFEFGCQRAVFLLSEGSEALASTIVPLFEKGRKSGFIQDIDHTDSTAANLLFIGRSDPPPCCPNLSLRLPLSSEIEGAMIGEEEMGTATYTHSSREIDSSRCKGVIFLEELDQIQDDTIPEKASLPRVQNP
jgi:hypothetical protein